MPHNSDYYNHKQNITSTEQFWINRVAQVIEDRKELQRRIDLLTKTGDEMAKQLGHLPCVDNWEVAKTSRRPTSIPDEND